jgi:hypothetical protein
VSLTFEPDGVPFWLAKSRDVGPQEHQILLAAKADDEHLLMMPAGSTARG